MTEKEKMNSGNLYLSNDPSLQILSKHCKKILDKFNRTKFNDFSKRVKLAKKLFGSIGEHAVINKPFFCDYGLNIHIGDNFYANSDCIFLDVCEIRIGSRVMMAPRVQIYTAAHPIDKDVRSSGLEYGKKVVIGDDVWIGGNVVINPGVTIGSNVVIGSGSVVTKDIPSGVIAAGNPCKVLRLITETDKIYWKAQQQKYQHDL